MKEVIWNDDTLIPTARLLARTNPALAGMTTDEIATKIKDETSKAMKGATEVTAFHSFVGFVATWYTIGSSTIVNFFVFSRRTEDYIAVLESQIERGSHTTA